MSSHLLATLEKIVGTAHVLTDAALTEGYVTDWNGRWHGQTAAVVRPGTTTEVAAVVRACAEARVGIVPQGGNTGLVGASVPLDGSIVLSTRRLATVDQVDPVERTLAAGAGVTLADAQRAAADAGLMLGIDLGARESATLGGAVATNAGGLRVVKHGSTRSQVLGLEVVLADGSVVRRWTGLAKDNVGYDLRGLFVGSEGTLGVITRVLLRLAAPPREVQVAIVTTGSLDDAHALADHLRQSGVMLEAAEFFFAAGLRLVREQSGLRALFDDDYPCYVLVEASGMSQESLATVLGDRPDLARDATLSAGPARQLWAYRESLPEAVQAAAQASGVPAIKIDVTLPRSRHDAFETALRETCHSLHPDATVISFGHLAEGNSHTSILGVAESDSEDMMDRALRLVVEHDGSISAEHGIGRAKKRWLELQRSPEDIAAMRAIKSALDPTGLLSPGVLFDHVRQV